MNTRAGDCLQVRILRRRWLSSRTLELVFSRPDGFHFLPGQTIRIVEGDRERDYSIASGPAESCLSLLVRAGAAGSFPALLASAPLDRSFSIQGPRGYFTHQPTTRPTVLAATGVGAAPFRSMVRGGLEGYTMLHGVSDPEELAYTEELRLRAALFVPCLSRGGPGHPGRVTTWVRDVLAPGEYDFYLCGRREMLRDVTRVVDERFPGSLVHTEIFY